MTLTEFIFSDYYRAITSASFGPIQNFGDGIQATEAFKNSCKMWWERLSDKNREIIKSIPNFDNEIFEEITGIKVTEEGK